MAVPTTYLEQITQALTAWEANFGPFETHPSLDVSDASLKEALGTLMQRLQGNYPFFHPRYAGQMLKPPHPAAVLGYFAAMQINPNNHALDGGPPTGAMEKEVVRKLGGMLGFPDNALGHLTGGGTVANLEALFVAREVHPDRGIAVSSDAHYTHARMGHVLRMAVDTIPTDRRGRMDLDALEARIKRGDIGTVVLTSGTTGLGAVDPIADALPLCRRHGVRVHIDAAYGGFFRLLADKKADGADAGIMPEATARHFRAIADADSVAIDPHKHGLQPYGCGAVLFRDPGVGKFYQHDSPYTYFTSDELHLGEISLECSRPGAAAAALWLTLEVLPLEADNGLGPILAACLGAAQRWHHKLVASTSFTPLVQPELDIITFLPVQNASFAGIDQTSQRLFDHAMTTPDPVFLSVLRASGAQIRAALPTVTGSPAPTRVLRSVLMKPEHEASVDRLHQRLTAMQAHLAGTADEAGQARV